VSVVSVWLSPGVRQDFHLQIRKKFDGWYFRCPEHHGRRGLGPFPEWELTLNIANLHLKNFNHF
jgi:hypothetical protein